MAAADPGGSRPHTLRPFDGVTCCATPGGKDVADALMEVKANVNLRDDEGNTPLHLACAKGTHRTVVSLLKYKVNDSTPKPRIQPTLDPP